MFHTMISRPTHAGLAVMALSLAAAWPLASQAQSSPPVASFGVKIGGLSLEVIDLTPDDGIAPGITFNTQGLFNVKPNPDGQTFSASPTTYVNSILPSSTLSAVDSTGVFTSTASTTAFSVRADVTLDHLLASQNHYDTVEQTTYYLGLTTESAVAQLTDAGRFLPGEFTLAPNTKVILHGALQSSRTLNGTAINQWLAGSGYDSFTATAGPEYLYASVQFQSLDGLPGEFTEGDTSGVFLDDRTAPVLSLSSADSNQEPGTVYSHKAFDIAFDNASDTALTGHFSMVAYVSPNFSLALNNTPVDPGELPEPGTYALMGLGLVGMALVRRRHRAA